MVNREKQALLGQVAKQAYQIVSAAANFRMLPLAEVIDPHVDLRPAGHPASDFLADKEVRVPPQFFGATDGVMVSQSDQIHAALSQCGVDLSRRAVTLQEKMTQDCHGHCSGMDGVDVQVAFHNEEMVSNEVC